jgi:hypothetical protein
MFARLFRDQSCMQKRNSGKRGQFCNCFIRVIIYLLVHTILPEYIRVPEEILYSVYCMYVSKRCKICIFHAYYEVFAKMIR